MSKRFQQYPKLISYSLFIGTLGTGCASVSKPAAKAPEKEASAQEYILKLEEKVMDLETRLNALNEKFNLINGEQPSSKADAEIEAKTDEKVQPAAAAKVKMIPKPVKPVSKFAESFHQDEATDRYREAKILFDTKKFSDSILEFSEFIKDNPRHLFASNAQYFIGMSYFRQKEYKIAEEELSRVLLNYPHSNAIPDTLLALAKLSGILKKPARVAYYSEKLNSHFANSPQSKQLAMENPPETAPVESAPAEKSAVNEEKISVEKPVTPEMNTSDTQGVEPSVVKQ